MSKLVTWIWTPPEGYTGEQVNAYCAVSYGMVLGLFGHILFLFLFWSLDLEALTLLNIGSVALFLIGAVLLAKRQMVLTSLAIGSVEVLIHGWIATVKLGWESSFHYHILAVLALWFLITGLPWITRLTIACVPAAVYITLQNHVGYGQAPSALAEETIQALSTMNLGIFCLGISGVCGYYAWSSARAHRALEEELSRSESLLHSILPASITEPFKEEGRTIADVFEDCSVLYADLVGGGELTSIYSQEEITELRAELFARFDDLAERYRVDKVRALGDSYMVTAGVSNPAPDHAARLADMGLEMQAVMEELRSGRSEFFGLRLGIHSGPAVAAVVGQRRFAYDLWEDTANTAAHIRAYGLPGEVQVTETTFALLHGEFHFEFFGTPEVEGRGKMKTYLLKARV